MALLIKDSINEAEEFFRDGLKMLLDHQKSDRDLLSYYSGIYNSIAINPENFDTHEQVLKALFSDKIMQDFSHHQSSEVNTNIWTIAKRAVDELLKAKPLKIEQIKLIFHESMFKCNQENKLELLRQIYNNAGSRYFTFLFKNRASQLYRLLISMFDEEYTIRFEPNEEYRSLVRQKAGEFIMRKSDDCVRVYDDISKVFMILTTPELVAKALLYKLIKAGESDPRQLRFYLSRINLVLKIKMSLKLKKMAADKHIQDYTELTQHLLEDLKTMNLKFLTNSQPALVVYSPQQILFVEKVTELMLTHVNNIRSRGGIL